MPRRVPPVPELLIDRFTARRRAGQPVNAAARGALGDVLEATGIRRAVSLSVAISSSLVAKPGSKARRRRRPAPPARAPQHPPRRDPELERLAHLKRKLDGG